MSTESKADPAMIAGVAFSAVLIAGAVSSFLYFFWWRRVRGRSRQQKVAAELTSSVRIDQPLGAASRTRIDTPDPEENEEDQKRLPRRSALLQRMRTLWKPSITPVAATRYAPAHGPIDAEAFHGRVQMAEEEDDDEYGDVEAEERRSRPHPEDADEDGDEAAEDAVAAPAGSPAEDCRTRKQRSDSLLSRRCRLRASGRGRPTRESREPRQSRQYPARAELRTRGGASHGEAHAATGRRWCHPGEDADHGRASTGGRRG